MTNNNNTKLSPKANALLEKIVLDVSGILTAEEWSTVRLALEDGELLGVLGADDQDVVEELYAYVEGRVETARRIADDKIRKEVLEARDNCAGNGRSIDSWLAEYVNCKEEDASVNELGDCYARGWFNHEETRTFLDWLNNI